jgi:CBS domain-containing protein/sporulation protein YlmC with PRC-barrel domain
MPGGFVAYLEGDYPDYARSPSRVKVGADDTTLGLAGNTSASELKRLLMTTTPAPGPSAPAGNQATLRLSRLLKRPVADRSGESIGRLADVIVRLRGADYPLVTGLVAAVGGREIFVPIDQVSSFDGEPIRLSSARLDLRHFERREGEVLLRRDVLGHRFIDVENARLVRAADLELAKDGDEWVLAGVDTRRRPRRLFGLLGPGSQDDAAVFRDWHDFEWLIGHQGSALQRGSFGRIRRLKPAQIADLLENASKEEETEILGQVHADPELEADVFEELDEDLATRLLGARTDEEIAAVLARMRADDAADAIAELPQRRRQPVLDLLPPGQRTKVLTLMGFNPTSAGGLMSMDFVAVPRKASVADALARVREAVSLQPEALTSVHAVTDKGRLRGVARLVTLVQSDPDATVIDVSDTDPVRVGPDADITDVAVLMTDYNLTTIPVVDDERRLLGVITVDDVLEVTLPGDWRRRETAEPPDAHYGNADREDAQHGGAP